MEKSIAVIILLENRSDCSFSLICIVSLCTALLRWLIKLHDFSSWIWRSLQTILHFLFCTWKVKADSNNNITANVPTSSKPCHDNGNVDNKLLRGEVEMVMEKLGIFCDPNGDELQERLGSEEIAALLEEKELGLEDVKEAFDVFDENSDGFIDANELEKVLCSLGFTEVLTVDCQKMIAAFDDNRDGRIDFSEFVKLLEKSSW